MPYPRLLFIMQARAENDAPDTPGRFGGARPDVRAATREDINNLLMM